MSTSQILVAVLLVVGGGAAWLRGCDRDIASSDVENFFRKHKVDGHNAFALKKRSPAGISYLATIHGFPNNGSVCEEMIAPYNKDTSLSVIPGEYFCEELR